MKVVLTGEGADELFLGYNRYRVTAWNERLGRPLRGRGAGGAARAACAASRRGAARAASAATPGARFLALEPGPRALFFENFAVFPRRAAAGSARGRALLGARDPYAAGCAYYGEAPGGTASSG